MGISKKTSGEIAYRESDGTSDPKFLLIHGNSSSSRSYQPLLETELGQKHRIVAIDLPGHGDSAIAPNAAATYTLPGYAKSVIETAKELDMMDAIFVGWSLGGHIALEAVSQLPDAKGFVIFGTPPLAFPPAMEAAFLPNPNMGSGFAAELTEDQMRAFVQSFFKPDTSDIPESFMEDIRKTDGQARATMGASIQPDGYADEVEIVTGMAKPLMIIHGTEEQLVNGDYFASFEMPTLWRGAVQMMDAGHAPHWEATKAFSQLLADFANEV